jgi:uncharacterized protein (DUF362 family)/Pyruvate/2-oxoacid:ferredoxin oxidoreductase delta subunit
MVRKSTVVLAACADYDRDRVYQAVCAGLDFFDVAGIVSKAADAGKPVLLKPNWLLPASPEKGVTTHPAVFSAVARYLKDRGAKLSFGDSPNPAFKSLAVARKSGVLEEAEALGIPMADFETGEDVSYPQGAQNRRFHVARGALAAGAIINLPRLKTHSFTFMTGALKNTFGVVPGGLKAEFHIKHPDVEGFSRMIVDLNGLVRSRLVVLDAIKAMEGNGPGSGDLVDVGLLILSEDPVAADAVGCLIMGIDPLSVPMIRIAHDLGLGNAHPESIDMRGEALAGHIRQGFKLPPRSPADRVPRIIFRLAKDLIVPKPVIDPASCIKCGECVTSCPTTPKALSQAKGAVPRYNYATCIRCYCCQETCREGAISVKRAPLGRFFGDRP